MCAKHIKPGNTREKGVGNEIRNFFFSGGGIGSVGR